MISLDISEYGDPLDSRSARVPYSRYLKPQQQKTSLGEQFIDNLPPIFEIPQHEMSVTKALRVMRDPEAVAELAQRAAGFVPDCSAGMETLISSYTASALAKFHRDFYSTKPDPPESWPQTYDRIDLEQLPPCARFILEHPNDLLLRPSGMRRIVAVSLSLGWHPQHIAGLIQSKFERDSDGERYGQAMIRRPVQNFILGFLPDLCWRGTMISWISTAILHASNARVTWLIVPTTCYGSGSPF